MWQRAKGGVRILLCKPDDKLQLSVRGSSVENVTLIRPFKKKKKGQFLWIHSASHCFHKNMTPCHVKLVYTFTSKFC